MRAIAPISSNIAALINLGLELIIFSFFLIFFGVMPSSTIVFLPFFILILFLITLGLSFALSILNVFYKDMKFIWNVVITAGFFIHPIIYTKEMLPEKIQELFSIIPTVTTFDMIHKSVLFGEIPPTTDFIYVIIFSLGILGVGYLVYRKLEPRMAEEL